MPKTRLETTLETANVAEKEWHQTMAEAQARLDSGKEHPWQWWLNACKEGQRNYAAAYRSYLLELKADWDGRSNASRNQITRAEFDRLSHPARSEFFHGGGTLID